MVIPKVKTVFGSDPAGGALLCVCGGNQGFEDVLIDGVTTYNTKVLDGIYAAATNLIIRNSTSHNVGASGIWVAYSKNVLMDSNVVYNVEAPGTSGVIGMWEWTCSRCTLQYNEVYNTTSADKADGGTFDVDYNNVDNTIQYNYGHDADGYCVSVFGATDQGVPSIVTTNTIIRYNICSDTSRGGPKFSPEGSIYIETWNHGKLDGVQIYNNTFYANPTSPVPALFEVGGGGSVSYTGNLSNFFKNNIIYSTVPQMILTTPTSRMVVDNNIYWFTGGSSEQSQWIFHGKKYVGFQTYQRVTGQDAHSQFVDPMLNDPSYHSVGRPTTQFTPQSGSPVINSGTNVCAGIPQRCSMGSNDFLGNPIPQGRAYDIGAIEVP